MGIFLNLLMKNSDRNMGRNFCVECYIPIHIFLKVKKTREDEIKNAFYYSFF